MSRRLPPSPAANRNTHADSDAGRVLSNWSLKEDPALYEALLNILFGNRAPPISEAAGPAHPAAP